MVNPVSSQDLKTKRLVHCTDQNQVRDCVLLSWLKTILFGCFLCLRLNCCWIPRSFIC